MTGCRNIIRSSFAMAATAVAIGSLALGITLGAPAAGAASKINIPGKVSFPWGTFHLAGRIRKNIRAKKSLTFDLSYQAIAEPGAPDLLRVGLKEGAAWVKKKYGMNIKVHLIGTPSTTTPTQISQIKSLTSAGEVTCVGVEPVTPGAFVSVINSTISAGVPVMTVNTDSPKSHRLAYYGVDDTTPKSPLWTGRIAGNFTVRWAKKHHVKLKSVALITGTTTAAWAQGRMTGWLETVKKAFPKVKVVGSPTNAFTTGYTPATIESDMQAFMTGHRTVQFYFDSDWGAAEIAQLIGSKGLKGKVFTLGFNVDSTYIKDLKAGTLIGTIDQRYDLQARNFVEGCANFLLGNKKPKPYEFIKPSIWTPTNVSRAIKLYKSIPGSLT